ncbi:MAG: DNA polymerase [Limnohabitans sp.]|nr:DNA polymerase [Limnohabitans sp.]
MSFIRFVKLTSKSTTHQRFHRKIIKTEYKIEHNLSTIPDLFKVENEIDDAFNNAVNDVIQNANQMDVISIKIFHDELNQPIYINRKKKFLKKEDFLNAIYKVSQSDKSFLLDGVIRMDVGITEQIIGKGKLCTKKIMTISEYRNKKKSLIKIKNNDSMCGFIAIAVALQLKICTPLERKSIIRNTRNAQFMLANQLLSNLNLPLYSELNILNIDKVSEYLSNLVPPVQMIIVNGHSRTIDYKSSFNEEKIYLELYNQHYNIISSIKAYMNKSYFCEQCFVGFNNKNEHKCKFHCDLCMKASICKGLSILCSDCNKSFKGSQCFNNHKELNVCENFKKCFKCDLNYKIKDNHKCLEYICKKCNDKYSITPHYCFIKPIDQQKLIEEDSKLKVIVTFDIESAIVFEDNSHVHKPNLLISMTVCDECSLKKLDDSSYCCNICGIFENCFKSFNCVELFSDYIYNILNPVLLKSKTFLYILAHNFRGYDGHFIMKDIFQRDFLNIETIMNGSKILCIKINNIIFLDSLSFFLQPLANLPKSFGFDNITLKGFFPFYLNNKEDITYNGSFPDKSFFGVETMSKQKLIQFNKWYEKENNKQYNLYEEAYKYCRNDVYILMLALLKFRNQFKLITQIDPITRNFTLASIGLEVFRSKYLNEYTIGKTPIMGYSFGNVSIHSNIWLDFNELKLRAEIMREFRVGKYFADGYNIKNNTLYEFFGCFFHGCPKCYTDRTTVLNFKRNESFNVDFLLDKVKRKLECYKSLGFNIIYIWECDFLEKKNLKPYLKNFYINRKNYYIMKKENGNASIKESFYGGRTNNLRFWYYSNENESIEYKDVCSEYPFVLKNKLYPIGHPKIIQSNFDYTLKSYFGFIKCIINPPKKLFLPVLPIRINNKLLFPLCKICALEKNQNSCKHSDYDRTLIGTWTSVELQKALLLGYKIIHIIEVLHYENKSEYMFKEYINLWLKEKQEASGWPIWVLNEADREKYLNEYEKHENVSLDVSKIEKNPGRRFIAKIMLNSFWGKFSQRPNMSKTKICKDYDQYWNIINNDLYEIQGEEQIDDDNIILCYKFINDDNSKPGNTNVAISSFVTAYARLHLYSFMEKVLKNGIDRLLYFDTDSIIYIKKQNDIEIETGDYLGELTDEIKQGYGVNAKITKFCSAGPKNYALEIESNGERNVIMKTKGICNYASNLNILNIQEMINIVKNYTQNKILYKNIDQTQIKSNKYFHFVQTNKFKKVYKAVSDKRRVLGNFTLPYGYFD